MNSRYREYRPCAALARYVECYWSRTSANAGASVPSHIVLPDGCMDIVFDFGDLWTGTGNQPNAPGGRRGGAVVGTMTAPLLVVPGFREDFFGVRFRPGVARAFFRMPAADFTDAAAPLGDVWGREAAALEEHLADSSTAGRISVLERELLRRLRNAPQPETCVEAAVRLILHRRGIVSVREACDFTGVTRQHLARCFAEHVGISPKLFSRVVRFQGLLGRVRATHNASWSVLAADSGYYDQAHLIADFRQFAGSTPERFVSERAV